MNVPTTAYAWDARRQLPWTLEQSAFISHRSDFLCGQRCVGLSHFFVHCKETRSVQGEFFEIPCLDILSRQRKCVADTLVAFFDCPFPANKVLSSVEGRVNSGGVVFFFSSSLASSSSCRILLTCVVGDTVKLPTFNFAPLHR